MQDAAARRLGLTTTERETLPLVQLDGPVIASELAKEPGLTRASMSAIVDKLANAGLLDRRQDPADRRCLDVLHRPDVRIVTGVEVSAIC